MYPIAAVTTGSVSDETALLDALAAQAVAAGWSVDIDGDTRWFQSSGEDGLHNACFGLEVDPVNRFMYAYAATDIDRQSFQSATPRGYIHVDATATIATSRQSFWTARTIGEPIKYRSAVSLDGLIVLVEYLASGAVLQGVLGGGRLLSHYAGLYRHARGRIHSVTPGAGVATIVLDRDINPALRDMNGAGTAFPAGIAPQSLFFQALAGAGEGADFCGVERATIVPGTLALDGSGRTQFDVNTAVAASDSRLFTSTGRYASGRGAADIVGVTSDPNFAISVARAGTVIAGAGNELQVAWNAAGAQGAQNRFRPRNGRAEVFDVNDPAPQFGRSAWYPMMAVAVDANASVLGKTPQTRGTKLVGYVPHLALVASANAPDFSLFEVDHDSAQRWIIMRATETGLTPVAPLGGVWMVGPGA